MKIKLLIAILFLYVSTEAQYTASEKADQAKYSSLATATDIVGQMAFWSDSTITSGQLIDKSGNGRHATITRNLITDSSGENGSTLIAWNGATGITNSSEQAHTGTYSRKFSMTGVASLKGARHQFFRTITGETVNWSIWVYRTVATTFKLEVLRGSGTTAYSADQTPTLNTWVNITGSFVESAGGGLAEMRVYFTSGDLTLYMDDLSVWITGKPNVGCYFSNDATLKAIDAGNEVASYRYQFYTSTGIPKTFRTDIGSPAFYNKKVFTGGYLKYVFLNAEPDAKTYYWLNSLFVDHDHFFNSCEVVKTVKVTAGDYATIQAALTAIGVSSLCKIDNRYRVEVYDDFSITTSAEYTATVSPHKAYFNMSIPFCYLDGIGTNRTISATLPASVSDATADSLETFAVNATTGARNLTFTKRNGRYVGHIDGANASTWVNFYKCKFINYGIQEVVDYRTANALPATLIAGGTQALGCGLKDYEVFELKNCTVSGINPFFIHSGSSTFALGKMIFYKSTVLSQPLYHPSYNPTSAILEGIKFSSLAQNLQHFGWVLNCSFNSKILNDCTYQTGTTIYDLKDWQLSLYKYAPILTTDFNLNATSSGSLRITGAAGAVVITGGTAQALLMPTPDYSGNMATGRLEVGEWPLNAAVKMGVRLGDCSSVNKTLTMTINGVAKTVTFNQNHTAQTNATILSFINTALAGSGTATLYQQANEYLPTIIY